MERTSEDHLNKFKESLRTVFRDILARLEARLPEFPDRSKLTERVALNLEATLENIIYQIERVENSDVQISLVGHIQSLLVLAFLLGNKDSTTAALKRLKTQRLIQVTPALKTRAERADERHRPIDHLIEQILSGNPQATDADVIRKVKKSLLETKAKKRSGKSQLSLSDKTISRRIAKYK